MSEELIISKARAVELFNGNQAALARALNIGRAAVSKWPDGPIPELYALKLRYQLVPEHFEKSA